MSLRDELMATAREAAERPGVDSRALAEKAVRRIGAANLKELAIREVADWIDRFRRDKAHEAERAAEGVRQRAAAEAKAQLAEATRLSNYDAWLADPSILDWGRERTGAGQRTEMLNSEQRKKFIRWLGDRYEEWYERGCAAVAEARRNGAYTRRSAHTYFMADYYRHGPQLWFAIERERRVEELIEQVSEEVRLETTAELLATVFALGDGRKTTWGEATVAEHQQRIAMLTKNAAGVVETAGRHRQAIRMIQDAGVDCLADLDSAPLHRAA